MKHNGRAGGGRPYGMDLASPAEGPHTWGARLVYLSRLTHILLREGGRA